VVHLLLQLITSLSEDQHDGKVRIICTVLVKWAHLGKETFLLATSGYSTVGSLMTTSCTQGLGIAVRGRAGLDRSRGAHRTSSGSASLERNSLLCSLDGASGLRGVD